MNEDIPDKASGKVKDGTGTQQQSFGVGIALGLSFGAALSLYTGSGQSWARVSPWASCSG